MDKFAEFGAAERKEWSETGTARSYTEGFATPADQSAQMVIEVARVGPGKKVFDCCCGHGTLTGAIAATGASVTGLGFSPAMLDIARSNVPGITLVEGDATDRPFDVEMLDAVIMGFGILHIPDAGAALREVRQVLRPGGRFVYTVWHAPDQSAAFRITFGNIARHRDPAVVLPPGPPLHGFGDPEYAFPIPTAAGFAQPEQQTADCYWLADEPAQLYHYFYDGTVRGALLMRSQAAANAAATRAAIEA